MLNVDVDARGTGRELHDLGRYVVLWLAPLMVWLDRREKHAWSLEETRAYARERPRERIDYECVNLARAQAWLYLLVASVASFVLVTFIRTDDLANPNPVVQAIFDCFVWLGMFVGGMLLQSGFRWGLAEVCSYRLLRLCVPTWADVPVALLFALLIAPAILAIEPEAAALGWSISGS